ncbi:MAG: hypothetical protein ACF788_06195 [Novipirellula sp. JB048]
MAFLIGTAGGCRLFRDGEVIGQYHTPAPGKDSVDPKVQSLNRKGVEAFEEGRVERAEELFRKALVQAVDHGPSHNNLGQVYLQRRQLYLAAWEFEYASKLMPTAAEPLINQALVYEEADRLQEAEVRYRAALSRQPQHPDAIGGLARNLVRQDGEPGEIAFLLDEVLLRDSRPDWIQWARELRQTRFRDSRLVEKSDEPSDEQSAKGKCWKREEHETERDDLKAMKSNSLPIELLPPGSASEAVSGETPGRSIPIEVQQESESDVDRSEQSENLPPSVQRSLHDLSDRGASSVIAQPTHGPRAKRLSSPKDSEVRRVSAIQGRSESVTL